MQGLLIVVLCAAAVTGVSGAYATPLSGAGVGAGASFGEEGADKYFGDLALHFALERLWVIGAELKAGHDGDDAFRRLYAGVNARYYFLPRRERPVNAYARLTGGTTVNILPGCDHGYKPYALAGVGADFPVRHLALSPYVEAGYQAIFVDNLYGATVEAGLRFDLW